MGREDAYRALLDEYGIDPDGATYSGEEDAKLQLDGDDPIRKYAIVTVSGEYPYVTARHDTLRLAKRAATSYVSDDVYAESPVLIVNLDTGTRYEPDWDALPWKKVTP